jgi:CRP/FNR family transcriptional regulator, anaerobic regulatory protein
MQLANSGDRQEQTPASERVLKLDKRCQNCPAHHRAICTALTPEISPLLSASMFHRKFRKHEKIWAEGDDTAYFAIIVSGAVKLVKLLADGRQQIVGMFFSSDCIDNPFSDENASYAEAAAETELCCFPKSDFERALTERPELEHALLLKTFQDLARTREWLVILGRKNAGERLASFLVSMMEQSAKFSCRHLPTLPQNVIFEIPVSRSEIADYLGLTLETVSRQFSRLKDAGIIDIHEARFIEVRNQELLCKAAGEPIRKP